MFEFQGFRLLGIRVPLKQIESGFGYIKKRSPYTSYSIYLRGIIGSRFKVLGFR